MDGFLGMRAALFHSYRDALSRVSFESLKFIVFFFFIFNFDRIRFEVRFDCDK